MIMLYRSTDRPRRCSAPMQNLAHSASFDSDDKNEPSKPGIKQLAHALALESGITEAQARELGDMIGMDRASLLREARLLKKTRVR